MSVVRNVLIVGFVGAISYAGATTYGSLLKGTEK